MDKPKRPIPAYLLFLRTVRATIHRENPTYGVRQIATRAGQMWRELQDRSEWNNQAAVLRQQYVRQMEEYRTFQRNERLERYRTGMHAPYRFGNPFRPPAFPQSSMIRALPLVNPAQPASPAVQVSTSVAPALPGTSSAPAPSASLQVNTLAVTIKIEQDKVIKEEPRDN